MKTLFSVLFYGFVLWFWGSICYGIWKSVGEAKKDEEKRTEEAKKRAADEAKRRTEEAKNRAEKAKKWAEEERQNKINDYRHDLISRILKTFQQTGLDTIPLRDIEQYCADVVDHSKSDNDIWKSVWDTITHKCKLDAKSMANRERAQKMGERLVVYKDTLAKRHAKALDTAEIEAILNDTSPDPVAAEHELVLAWRVYTIEREQQIVRGQFHVGSTQDEIASASRFLQSRGIVFHVSNVKGVAHIKAQILATIAQDISADDAKWSAAEASDNKLKVKLRAQYYGSKPPPIPLDEPDPARDEYAEGNVQWGNDKLKYQFDKHYGSTIDHEIRIMLNEHKDYWVKHPNESYDDSLLNQIFDFSVYGGNYGLGSLFAAWKKYLELRILLDSPGEDKTRNSDARRNLPIKFPHEHPNAREIAESHIRKIIREDILSDIENIARREKESAQRQREFRRKRSQKLREAFIRKVHNLYGQEILDMISQADIELYCCEIIDHHMSEADAWYSVLTKYEFDGNTNSCLYFIRQGDAIKIGITDSLDRRLAQIKTSASGSCTIENVVYTHHGMRLERKLHQCLSQYRSHLEWFHLPEDIERMLLAAKSTNDIERTLKNIAAGKLDNGLGVVSGQRDIELPSGSTII